MALGEDDIRHPSPQKWVFNVSVFEARGHRSLCSLGSWWGGGGSVLTSSPKKQLHLPMVLCFVIQASSGVVAKPAHATYGDPCHSHARGSPGHLKARPLEVFPNFSKVLSLNPIFEPQGPWEF